MWVMSHRGQTLGFECSEKGHVVGATKRGLVGQSVRQVDSFLVFIQPEVGKDAVGQWTVRASIVTVLYNAVDCRRLIGGGRAGKAGGGDARQSCVMHA